jgi:hypothetical protein
VDDELIGLYEPSYTVRVTFVEGGGSQLDFMYLETTVPVENSTWGAIKTIYNR